MLPKTLLFAASSSNASTSVVIPGGVGNTYPPPLFAIGEMLVKKRHARHMFVTTTFWGGSANWLEQDELFRQ